MKRCGHHADLLCGCGLLKPTPEEEAKAADLLKAMTKPLDWTHGHTYSDLRSRTLIVDGVTYSAAEVRRIVQERHQQALEITRLRATLKRADRHLKLRTAALVRLIAAERPAALTSDACGERTCCSSRASGCSLGRSKAPAGSG